MSRGRLLILSFSSIASDARVLKQVALFTELYDVVTCGFGPAPAGVVEHVRIPDEHSKTNPTGNLVSLRWYRRAYWTTPAVAYARSVLPVADVDVVLANDVEAVPLALALRPRLGVHADLHEFAPALHAENPDWKRRIAPYLEWICRTYVVRAASVTTVGQGLADEYRAQFGIEAGVVTNAAPFADLAPQPVADAADGPLRLVHSGGAQRKRRIDLLLDAVEATGADVTLDLYLMANDPAFLAELRERAAGSTRVRLHDPVPYAHLMETLNGCDVGLHLLPPVDFNSRWALPNKLFDYVQARLGLIIGPSPEMATRVREWGVGVVTEDFTAESLTAVLDGLDRDTVRGFKAAAHARARDLSAENEVIGWRRAVDALMGKAHA